MYEVHWLGYDRSGEKVDNTHGTFDTIEEAQKSVRDWWIKNKYEPPYVRQWTVEDGTVVWDYGLHYSGRKPRDKRACALYRAGSLGFSVRRNVGRMHPHRAFTQQFKILSYLCSISHRGCHP